MKKIIILCTLAASAIIADPLVSYPGTKAKGMGGAFTAIANNNSAMYFNPAGMVNFESKMKGSYSRIQNQSTLGIFSVELGTGAALDLTNTQESPVSSTFNYFVAGGFTNSMAGGGVAIYSLYSVKAYAKDMYGYVNAKEQDISAISASGALAIAQNIYPGGGKLSIGATLGVAFSGSGLLAFDMYAEDGTVLSSYTDNTLDQMGYFAALGLKARVLKSEMFNIDLGVNYRTPAKMESALSPASDTEGAYTTPVNGMDMPYEFDYGLAMIYLTEYGVFTVAVDKKITGYEDATSEANSDLYLRLNDYETFAVGVDFSAPGFQIRGGYYKSNETKSSLDTDSLNLTGYTLGAGYAVNGNVNIEFSIDNKVYEMDRYLGEEDQSELFASLSLNVVFVTVQ